METLIAKHKILIVFGDFNLSNISWPLINHPHDTQSQLFINFLENSGLEQIINEPTRFRLNQQPSQPDLTLTSDVNLLTNISVTSPIGKSDHAVISTSIQILKSEILQNNMLMTYKRINYHRVNLDVSTANWADMLNGRDVNKQWEIFEIF